MNTGFRSLKVKLVVYFSLFMMIISLFNHSRIWRMHVIENKYLWYEKLVSISHNKINLPIISNSYNDTIYIYSIWIGLLVSIITLLLIIFLFMFNNEKERQM